MKEFKWTPKLARSLHEVHQIGTVLMRDVEISTQELSISRGSFLSRPHYSPKRIRISESRLEVGRNASRGIWVLRGHFRRYIS